MSPRAVVLCFLFRAAADGGRQVLLGRKKTGFGKGRIVTLGGHVEVGESPAAAAVREVEEESRIVLAEDALTRLGHIDFVFPARPEWNMATTVFTASRFAGSARVTDEIAPAWYPTDRLPFEGMWPDSALWMPKVTAGEEFSVTVTLGRDNESVDSAVFA